MIAVCQDIGTPTALNQSSSARPRTGCGKKIGSSTSFWNRRRPRQS